MAEVIVSIGGRKCPKQCQRCKLNLKILSRKQEKAKADALKAKVSTTVAEETTKVLEEEFGGIDLDAEIQKMKLEAGGLGAFGSFGTGPSTTQPAGTGPPSNTSNGKKNKPKKKKKNKGKRK